MTASTRPASAASTVPSPLIAVEINTATRKLHTELNGIIIDRLPLALPPQANDLSRYALGLERFARVYFAFEEAFGSVAQRASSAKHDGVLVNSETHHDRAVETWLANLRPSGLARSDRLRADLSHLRTRTKAIQANGLSAQGSAWLETLRSPDLKPHVLVAYAWIMYMAIFSGGRWVREQLSSAGPEFWTGGHGDPADQKGGNTTEYPGFTFLCFGGDEDGEELKSTFKHRLAEADAVLTPLERQEVIDEAQKLFARCIDITGQLDREVWFRESSGSPPIGLVILGIAIVWLGWMFFSQSL